MFIHSFILETYIALLERLQFRQRTKMKVFGEMSNLEGWAISRERSSFQADGPTTKKTLRCIIAKRARSRDQKFTLHSRMQHPIDARPRPTLGCRGHKGKRGHI